MTVGGLVSLAADNSELGKAGPIGLLMILLIGVAMVFLTRSMLRHLRRVPASFDPPPKDVDDNDRPDT